MNPTVQDPSVTVLSEPTQVVSFDDSSRCHYRYANGKRCRLSGPKLHFGLCPQHFRLTNPGHSVQWHNDSEDLAAALLPNFPNSSPRSVLTSFSRGSWSSLPKAAFHRAAPPS